MEIKVITHFGECVYETGTVLKNKLKEKQKEVSKLLSEPFEEPKVHIVIKETVEDTI
jgi:hypothetical protein|tara:strand:+ start:892 stop:1062 length:171 start_codon:yes stop_codon:yes gene_type:complete